MSLGVVRKTDVGYVDSPALPQRICEGIRAALGATRLRALRLARFGDNAGDAATEGDKAQAQASSRVNDLIPEVEAATNMIQLVPECAGLYFVADELHRLAVQRLTADGYGFGGEGDWKSSVLLRTCKSVAQGLSRGTSWIEAHPYDLVPEEEQVLGAPLLEVCPSITTTTPSLEIAPLSIGGREDPVRLCFVADAGPGLVGGRSDLDDRLRITLKQIAAHYQLAGRP